MPKRIDEIGSPYTIVEFVEDMPFIWDGQTLQTDRGPVTIHITPASEPRALVTFEGDTQTLGELLHDYKEGDSHYLKWITRSNCRTGILTNHRPYEGVTPSRDELEILSKSIGAEGIRHLGFCLDPQMDTPRDIASDLARLKLVQQSHKHIFRGKRTSGLKTTNLGRQVLNYIYSNGKIHGGT